MIEKIVYKNNKEYYCGKISNKVIGTLDFGFEEFSEAIVVENCIIDTLIIYATWFHEGFTLKNCIINNKVLYETAGHNNKPIIFSNNIFKNVFVFFGCIFEADFIITNNIFIDNCTLHNGYNEFNNVTIENNIGKMDDGRWD